MTAELFSAELVNAIRACTYAGCTLSESEGLTSVKYFRQYIENLLSHLQAAEELFTPDLQRAFAIAYSRRIPGGGLEPPILFPEAYTSQLPSHHAAGMQWLRDVLGLINAQLEFFGDDGLKSLSDAELWQRMRDSHPFMLNIARYIDRLPETFGIILAAERLAAEQLLATPLVESQALREPEIPLTDEDVRIILFLQQNHPALQKLIDIETANIATRKTAGISVNKLISAGLLNRPLGKRDGVGLTDKGRTIALAIRPPVRK